ncbi:MAG: glycosyltransferase family 2 protein [Nitrospiraceae bacterium]
MDNITLALANRMFREGRYAEARRAYLQLRHAAPHLESIIEVNEALMSRHMPEAKCGSSKPQGTTVRQMYEEIARSVDGATPHFTKSEAPLATIVLTSHNTADYIEACLESLLSQSYPNIEILVVDDASEDRTTEIVRRIARANGSIRLLQLNANLGTYFAKNLGVAKSRGDVLFFQDSDDISHPYRIAMQVAALLGKADHVAVRCAYSRFDPSSEFVIPVNGLISKLGLITLGVKRSVFKEIGYFNCSTKASDDEFYQRIIRVYGKEKVSTLNHALYFATTRTDSLFADMVTVKADGSIEQRTSSERAEYLEAFTKIHKDTASSGLRARFTFPRIRDAVKVAPGMSKLANPTLPVIVNVCSIPRRARQLERALRSIAPQCDEIHLYLDGYDESPAFVRRLGVPVTVCRSQDRPGLRDNGKFIRLEELCRQSEDAYYFTLDDDIEYPVDYVNALVKRLGDFEDDVVVGVHGVTLKSHPRGYFSDRRIVYAFGRSLERSTLVNVLGTGTIAFRAARFKDFSLSAFRTAGMADLYFAVDCVRRGLPQICVARPSEWLVDLGAGQEDCSLYEEFRSEDSKQSALIGTVREWGVSLIRDTVLRAVARNPRLAGRFDAVMPMVGFGALSAHAAPAPECEPAGVR